MKTVFRTSSIVLAAVLLMAGRAFSADTAGPKDVLDKEKELVKGSEINNIEQTAPVPVAEPAKVDRSMPRSLGERDGFWARFKKAFAYQAKPQNEPTDNQIAVNVLMVEGRELFRKGEYHKALETFKEVIQRDPYNVTARRYIKECQEMLLKISVDDFDIARREGLQKVDRGFILQTRTQREIAESGSKVSVASPADASLQRQVPAFKLTDTKIADVFEYLYQNTDRKVRIDIDQESLKKLTDENKDTVSVNFVKPVPMIEVIKYICRVTGLTYRMEQNKVIIAGKDSLKIRSQVFALSRRNLGDIDLGAEMTGADPQRRARELLRQLGIPDVPNASVYYDVRRNYLTVVNTDANLKIVDEFIRKYDETPYQVQIEARFVTILNDDMTQLVFRHFLKRDYTWDTDGGRYNDRYNITAPNIERELTPGLRYIRSYVNEMTYDPLVSAYELPTVTSSGDAYEDYLAKLALKPNLVAYGDTDVRGAQTLYKSILAQQSILVQKTKEADAVLQARNKYVPASYEWTLLNQSYNYAMTNLTDGVQTLDAALEYNKQLFNVIDYNDKVANDGLGKVMDVEGVLGPAMWRSVIYALDNAQGVNTIFAPKVTVKTGQRAEIKDIIKVRYNTEIDDAEDPDLEVGDAFQYVTDYAVTPRNWEEREYGTSLKVTPSVQPDGRTIELDVQPEVSDLVAWRQWVASRNNVFELPQFFVQSVRTLVKVNDGDTVVMGGLMRDQMIRTDDKVPILGDLPLIGRFWRSNTEVARKSNLMIFLNAKLIDPSGQTRRRMTTVR